MSEITKNFVLKKTTPNDVMFYLSPISNTQTKRLINLTSKMPQIALPVDWALGVFFDDGVYKLYKKGVFTFNDNDSLVKAAVEAGVYFDETLDFEPAKENDVEIILASLKTGNRANILKMIEKSGKEKVQAVATLHIDELTAGVISMLESALNIQLSLNED